MLDSITCIAISGGSTQNIFHSPSFIHIQSNLSMSLDINKWSDHLLLLYNHAQGLLAALYCAKQFVDPEATSPASDILARGGSPDVSFTYNGSPVTPVSASRPALERLRVLAEAGETGLADFFKKIVKKFPEVGDITKVC